MNILADCHKPSQLAAMKILSGIVLAAQIGNPPLFPSIIYTMVDLCLNYGNSTYAPLAYVYHGLLLCHRLGDLSSGYQQGQLALRLLDQFETRAIRPQVEELFYAFIAHRQQLVRQTIADLNATVQRGLETGQIEWACYGASNYCAHLFLVGEPLESVASQQQEYLDLIAQLQQEFQLDYTKIWSQLVGQLKGETGKIFQRDEMAAKLRQRNNLISLFSLAIENNLPSSIINYVVRTGKTIVLNDGARLGNFTRDPYIIDHQSKSILCYSLLHQGKLMGIVYLENNLTYGAFTPDRLKVLKLLSGQAVIAIANAQLYAEVREAEKLLQEYNLTLEQQVAERTQELERKNKELETVLEERKEAELALGFRSRNLPKPSVPVPTP